MKILVSGCSFTRWPEYPGGPNTCWPRWLQEQRPDWEINSVAEAAAGNQYIANSVTDELLKDNSYDMVLVMWSGVSRLDFLTDVSDPDWSALFDSYGFYRRMDNGTLGYIFSGGEMGTWFQNKVAYKMFYEQYKVSSHASLAYTNLMEMVKLQNLLKARGKKYYFMSYVNYWGTGEHVSPNGDFGVAAIPEVNHLVNSFERNRWIFTNSQGDGIYEMAKAVDGFKEDKFHPNDEIQQQWAQVIIDKLETDASVNM
tara:strand:+ start:2700 stop:3464 length:765 start_codon:yes stop_codon:yes gene_type:complete